MFDVVMPTHNNLHLTMQAVDSLYKHTMNPFHLIVVDDSTDLTPQYFSWLNKDNLTFIHSGEPYKCGNQFFNIAIKHMKHDYLATVMNSIKVEPEWDMVPMKVLTEDATVGGVGLKSLFPNGTIESAGITINNYTPVDIGLHEPGHRRVAMYECPAVQWAFAIFRKVAIDGILEENVYHGFVGWDDIDNCFVLKKNGWKIVYCGASAGYHEPRATRGSDTLVSHLKNQANAQNFYRRWGLWELFRNNDKTTPDFYQLVPGKETEIDRMAKELQGNGFTPKPNRAMRRRGKHV